MVLLAALWPVLVALVVALIVLGGASTAARRDPVRQVRGRLWLSLTTFGVAIIASWLWSTAQPGLMGLPVVVGPGAGFRPGCLLLRRRRRRAPGSGGRAGSRR